MNMTLKHYETADTFLAQAQSYLEQNEAAASLPLGIGLQLKHGTSPTESAPYFATVEDEQGMALVCLVTPPHNLVLYTDREPDEDSLKLVAQDLIRRDQSIPGVVGTPLLAEAFAQIWAASCDTTYNITMHQRIYALHSVNIPRSVNGHLRLATESDLNFLTPWYFGFISDTFGNPDQAVVQQAAQRHIANKALYLWVDDEPVSMAMKTRATAHGISISYVYTPPHFRRLGYASACVAALSQKLLDDGFDFCCLFTDLANPTSNAIYQKIGYEPVCDVNMLHFED
ncbi:MAG: GNAT family N-acetyltransferase [Chloroflexota bacterium]